MLTIELLGEVEAHRDGALLAVPSGKTTELLVRLALEAGRSVRTEVLLEDLWGGSEATRNTLQSKVSQLRRALGDKDVVHSTGDGYRLMVEPQQVDAYRVMTLAAEASVAREDDDPADAAGKTTEALGLFRGEVLVGHGDWATTHRVQLEELRLTLLECAVAARSSLGAGGELIAELEVLVALHPLRERLWETLITALYRAGRQADALATYQRVRNLLLEELGVEPGAALRELETQVLRQSEMLSGSRVPRARVAPGNLPPRPLVLVGRASDSVTVSALMDEHRLVCIVGPAGVGKTALALALAQQCNAPGGVWLIRLEGVDAGADLRRVVAETLHIPGGAPGLEQRLTGAETMLLLDNCEHMIPHVAELASHLLAAVPTLRLLLTSQVRLGIDEERVHHLSTLGEADGVTLFATRAQALREQFTLDDEAVVQVSEICRSLDGLPLAIELAAARARSMSVRDIARRLDDRFALLRDPSSTRTERRRALAGAIGWSYELLFPDDQRGLWALSSFAGSACLDAVEHVMAELDVPQTAALDAVTRLVDRSLVEVDTDPDGSVRYRLLDSIRAYASDRLEEAGGTRVVRAAHASWYAETATWCDDHIRTSEQGSCLAVVRAERTNIDVALTWCRQHDPRLGAQIAVGMGWAWVVLGDGTAGAARIRDALTPAVAVRQRIEGLLLAGWLEASAGDLDLAGTDLDAARALADFLGDELMLADVFRHQAFLALQKGLSDLTVTAAHRSLATYRSTEHQWRMAGSLVLAAYGALMTGDTTSATRDASTALGMLTEIGDAWALVHAQALLGGIAEAEGRFPDAANALREAADKSRSLGFPGQTALHLATLAQIEHRLGRDARAVRTFQSAIAEAEVGADGRLASTARLHLAQLLRARGAEAAALPLLEENRDWYAHAGGGEGALLTRCLLHAQTDDRSGLAQVLREAQEADNTQVQIYALDAQAREAAQREDHNEARALLLRADDVATLAGAGISEQDRCDKQRALSLLAARSVGDGGVV